MRIMQIYEVKQYDKKTFVTNKKRPLSMALRDKNKAVYLVVGAFRFS